MTIEDWDSLRDSHTPPRYVSSFDGGDSLRAEFMAGADLLGIADKLQPQQLVIADALNAVNAEGHPLNPMVGVLIPRRSSKTTSILAVLLGRCASRPNYRVAFTLATTGQKARDRFRADIVGPLERLYPDENNRPFRIRKAAGSEAIEFENGSLFRVLTPSGESFRSDAFDCVFVDEAGEATPETTTDLLTGILPTMDTRPDAQIIIAGTAAKYRTGNMLWDVLQKGRAGEDEYGIVEYAASQDVTVDDIPDWDAAVPLVLEAHPGIGTLTTLAKVKRNFDALPREQFMREYLSVFEDAGFSESAVNLRRWLAAQLDTDAPEPPKRFAIGVAVTLNQTAASIVAAWREDGDARVLVLDHRPGTVWVADRLRELAKYKVPIVYNNIGTTRAEIDALLFDRAVKPYLKPQTMTNVSTAAALFVREVDNGRIGHWDDQALLTAVQTARKRQMANAWGFGRGNNPDADITALEAASMALRVYDEQPAKKPMVMLTAA